MRVNPDVLVLVHGGPVAEPRDAEYILAHTEHCHGFYGAFSMERLPTERALTEQTRRFKAIKGSSDQSTVALEEHRPWRIAGIPRAWGGGESEQAWKRMLLEGVSEGLPGRGLTLSFTLPPRVESRCR